MPRHFMTQAGINPETDLKSPAAYRLTGSHSATLLHKGECAVVSEACAEFGRVQHALLIRALERGVAEGAFAVRDVDATARALVLAYSSLEPPVLLQLQPGRRSDPPALLHRGS